MPARNPVLYSLVFCFLLLAIMTYWKYDHNSAHESLPTRDTSPVVAKDCETPQVKVSSRSPKCTDRVCTQEERMKRLREQCNAYDNSTAWYDPNKPMTYYRLLVDDHHKILYCALPKAASTTMYNMFYLAVTGKELDSIHCKECWEKEGLVWLSKFSKEERDKRLRDYYKIMVVRNPMDRLVSCWFNKYSHKRKDNTWLQHGPKMVELFRNIPQNSSLEKEIDKGVTFKEFVQYVSYLEKRSPDLHNQHWKPHYRMCHPCTLQYDLIVKVETLDHDSKFIVDKLGLNMSALPLINARRADEEDNTLKLGKTLDNYKDIPQSFEDDMLWAYSRDMDLFDYTWNHQKRLASCGGKCTYPNQACC